MTSPHNIDLSEMPFGQVLLQHYRTKTSGLLLVQHGDVKKVVVLNQGQPRACRSNVRQEILGRFLVQQGVLDQATVDRVVSECKQTDGFPLGAALVSRGLIDPTQLAVQLEAQLRMRLVDLFSWTAGTVELRSGKGDKQEQLTLSTPTPVLILQGVIEAGEQTGALRNFDQSLSLCTVHDAAVKLEDFQLKGPQIAFLKGLNGRKSVAEVLAQIPSKGEAIRLIYGLYTLGSLAAVGAPASSSRAGVVQSSSGAVMPGADTADNSDLARRINATLEGIAEKTFFDLLGVTRDSDPAEVRKKYFSLAKDYHPDRLRKLPDAMRQKGEELFARISEAYNTLNDPNKLATYLETLEFGTDDATEEAARILESEALFQKGRSYIRQGEFRGAKKVLDEAIVLHPDEPEYKLYLGWADYKLAAAAKDEAAMAAAHRMIDQHKDARKRLEVGYLYLGQIAKLEGDNEAAKRHFVKATEINADCHEAFRELRLIEMRGAKKGKSLKSLFKKGG